MVECNRVESSHVESSRAKYRGIVECTRVE